jgi:mannose-6-phosphate isomerase-like protein (cupin superfamily)
MAVMLEGGCRVTEMFEGDAVVNGTARIWHQIGRATGAQAISLRVMEFAPGFSPTIQNADCDQILYVLDNGVHTNRSSEWLAIIDGRPYELSADSGIYLRPRQTFAVNNLGGESLTVISSQCPDLDRPPQFTEQHTNRSSTESSNPSCIVRLADQKAQPTADRWYRVLIDERVGSEQVTQFVGSIPPGRAPDHFHHYEEVLFILKGEGRMWAGDSNTPVAAGSCIYLPKGQVHCLENTGVGELRLLGVFYPAGSPSVRYDV